MAATRFAEAGVLRVAYEESGDPGGWPAVLLHGFPYDGRAYDAVAPVLAAEGARVIVPWLRGYGETRFLSPDTPRSGEQAALGRDLLHLLDALGIGRAVLVGYDWGGRAACIVSALWPERVAGLVSQNGYNIQDIARSGEPLPPEDELRLWYQYYFHSERGRAGLARDRRGLCRLLWRLWSPEWGFDEATFERTAASFDNPDFVEVVIHSYRHRFGLVPGAARYEDDERFLATLPAVEVPAIVLDPTEDPALRPRPRQEHARSFPRLVDHRRIASGHDQPFDAPAEVADAVRRLHAHLVERG